MNSDRVPSFNRRNILQCLAGAGVGSLVFQRSLASQVEEKGEITAEMIGQAEWIAGLTLDEEEREDVARSIRQTLVSGQRLREQEVDADQAPALVFRPDFIYEQVHRKKDVTPRPKKTLPSLAKDTSGSPSLSDDELAFTDIQTQAKMLASKQISSRELTKLYLARLTKYDPLLKCVITLLEDHALKQADASDSRRSKSKSVGILDGIPWVAKDLIALPPYKTTWGAEPFKDQVREETATVATRLESAGAVLLAKVTLGAMAWGDRWFGGTTRNPWNPQQGSSGSSAGSASAVAAGCASFALGSETLGSIVSPTRRCRTSGLRPTFGRVSRAGCMPLSWSMDKIGPIARHVDDLAQVFSAIAGPDGKDPTLVNRKFKWPFKKSIKRMKVGVTGDRLSDTEAEALQVLKGAGAKIVEVDLGVSVPESAMSFILGVEASTVFDDAFRADQKADYGNWPSTLRQSQFVPAIQYLRANRMRCDLIREAEEKFASVDLVLGGNDLLLTNLSGHPSIVVAAGADESRGNKMPGVVKLTAAAYQESTLLRVGQFIQQEMPPQPSMPNLDGFLTAMTKEEDTEKPPSPDGN